MNYRDARMKTKQWVSLFLGLVLCLAYPAYADTLVWKVTRGGEVLYIGGTIHVLSASDYPLPVEYDQAYRQADTVILETDLQRLQTPQMQQLMLSKMTYSDGRTLKQVLSKKTYQSLEDFFADRNMSMTAVQQFKPGMASMMMTMLELQRLGLVGVGVDQFYTTKARADKKALGQLESVEQQLDFLAGMGDGQEDELIAYTLRDLKKLTEFFNALKQAWRQGDVKELETLGITELKQQFPQVYNSLLVKRNNAWIPQIELMLNTKEVEFVLVGALHLVGAEGVIEQLKAKGYQVELL